MERKYFFLLVIVVSVMLSFFTTIATYLINVLGLNIDLNPAISYVLNLATCYLIVLYLCKQFWIHYFGACEDWMNKNTRLFPKKEKNRKLQQTTA